MCIRWAVGLPAFCAFLAHAAPHVLVVYHSESNHTRSLAESITAGARESSAEVRLLDCNSAAASDVKWAHAIAIGSPTHYGNPAAALLTWVEREWEDLWMDPQMAQKAGAVFATGGGLNQGVEHVVTSLQRLLMSFRVAVISPDPTRDGYSSYGAVAVTGTPPFNSSDGSIAMAFASAGKALGHKLAAAAAARAAPPGPSSLPTVFVTEADGSEQLGLAKTLLAARGGAGVIAGVADKDGEAARILATLGATVRLVEKQPVASTLAGVDYLYLIPPNSPARLARGRQWVVAARAAKVKNVLLLSVVGIDSPSASASLAPYLILERELADSKNWQLNAGTGRGGFTALRTVFYQENLLLWAQDVQAHDGAFRLPFKNCFVPLAMADVAAVVVALTRTDVLPSRYHNVALNLTGPEVLEVSGVGAAAEAATGGRFTSAQIERAEAFGILSLTGNISPPSEVNLLLDIVETQTARTCTVTSGDVEAVAGRRPTSLRNFFAENAGQFSPRVAGASSGLASMTIYT